MRCVKNIHQNHTKVWTGLVGERRPEKQRGLAYLGGLQAGLSETLEVKTQHVLPLLLTRTSSASKPSNGESQKLAFCSFDTKNNKHGEEGAHKEVKWPWKSKMGWWEGATLGLLTVNQHHSAVRNQELAALRSEDEIKSNVWQKGD